MTDTAPTTEPNEQTETEPEEQLASRVGLSPKVEQYAEFFGMPVAVQLVRPCVTIVPRLDEDTGRAAVVAVNGADGGARLVGLPSLTEPPATMIVVQGVLRASPCGQRLVFEQSIASPRGFTDLSLHPDQIEYLTFVKEIPGARWPREDERN